MKLKFWLGIGISLICLYLVFRNIEVGKVFETMRSVNYFYLVAAIILQLSTIWLRAERWKYLLAPIKQLTFTHLLPATMIGFMANNVLPARAGEFVRAYVIGKKEHISSTASFATIIIERVCDMITMLAFLFLIIFAVNFPAQTALHTQNSLISLQRLQFAGVLSAIFIFCLLVFLILLKEFPAKTTAVITLLLRPFPPKFSHKILEIIASFRMGLQVLQTGTHLFFLIFWSIAVWLTAMLSAWATLQAFDLDLPFIAAIFMTVITAFSAAIPSSPGYVGPFHAAVSASVLFFLPDLGKSHAAGIAIIFHLVCVLPITLFGVYYLWRENMSFSEIQHIDDQETPGDVPVEPTGV